MYMKKETWTFYKMQKKVWRIIHDKKRYPSHELSEVSEILSVYELLFWNDQIKCESIEARNYLFLLKLYRTMESACWTGNTN